MNSKHSLIDINQAKKIASEKAEPLLKKFIVNNNIPLLQDYFIEGDECWMFFMNKAITIPEEYSLNKGAYVVSKKGAFRHIADFSDEPEKLQAYLKTMSKYFKEKGE